MLPEVLLSWARRTQIFLATSLVFLFTPTWDGNSSLVLEEQWAVVCISFLPAPLLKEEGWEVERKGNQPDIYRHLNVDLQEHPPYSKLLIPKKLKSTVRSCRAAGEAKQRTSTQEIHFLVLTQLYIQNPTILL